MIDIIKKEVMLAQGCTDPIAIALASSVALDFFEAELEKSDKLAHINGIEVKISKNLMKNSKDVFIPGTEFYGMENALFFGLVGGKSQYILEVLKDLKSSDIKKALELSKKTGIKTVFSNEDDSPLYFELVLKGNFHFSKVILENDYSNISYIENEEGIILDKREKFNQEISEPEKRFINLEEIFNYCDNCDINDLTYIKNVIEQNEKLSYDGLENNFGLQVGKTLLQYSSDSFRKALAYTAAASDARMGGTKLSAYINTGSGNQGILATNLVSFIGKFENISNEKIIRAVAMSHLITIWIKGNFGKMSSFCGAFISGIGACSGLIYLFSQDLAKIKSGIQNMLGDLSGIICDGAKPGCSLKVESAGNSALKNAMLALNGIEIGFKSGILQKNVEESILNFCSISKNNSKKIDEEILNILLKK